jgi:hypothetical protein
MKPLCHQLFMSHKQSKRRRKAARRPSITIPASYYATDQQQLRATIEMLDNPNPKVTIIRLPKSSP